MEFTQTALQKETKDASITNYLVCFIFKARLFQKATLTNKFYNGSYGRVEASGGILFIPSISALISPDTCCLSLNKGLVLLSLIFVKLRIVTKKITSVLQLVFNHENHNFHSWLMPCSRSVNAKVKLWLQKG